MSILRAYTLFRTMGCRHMPVVDIGHQVVGMLTRNELVDVCNPHPPHGHHGPSHHTRPAQSTTVHAADDCTNARASRSRTASHPGREALLGVPENGAS
eukprot:1989081-Prymnesium_polylepis.1